MSSMTVAHFDAKVHSVLLVDDHPVFREGLRELLTRNRTTKVVGEASEAERAIQVCQEQAPDIVVLDISLGKDNGLALIPKLRGVRQNLRILVMSMLDETVFAERALRLGANGYVMKDQAGTVVIKALERVASGKTYISEVVSERLLLSLGTAKPDDTPGNISLLSDREIEVMRLIGQGHQTKSIAQTLNVSIKTVETHRARIKEKLAVDTATELTVLAVNWLRDGFLRDERS